MMNKTQQQVEVALASLEKELNMLQNSQTRLQILAQFQRQGVTQKRSMPFTTGKGQRS